MVQSLAQLTTSNFDGKGLKIGVLVPRSSLQGINVMFCRAYEVLTQGGVEPDDIHVISVPNFYELATVVEDMLARDDYDAIICFGPASRATTGYTTRDALAHGFRWVALLNSNRPALGGINRGATINRGGALNRGATINRGGAINRAPTDVPVVFGMPSTQSTWGTSSKELLEHAAQSARTALRMADAARTNAGAR